MKSALFLLCLFPISQAFLASNPVRGCVSNLPSSLQAASPIEVSVTMPPSGSGIVCNIKVDPILDVPSEIIEVRYKVPFGLNVEPQKNLAVCTKDGAGGEKVGDILRYTSQWTLGLPQGDGVIATASMFAGGVSNMSGVPRESNPEFARLTKRFPYSTVLDLMGMHHFRCYGCKSLGASRRSIGI